MPHAVGGPLVRIFSVAGTFAAADGTPRRAKKVSWPKYSLSICETCVDVAPSRGGPGVGSMACRSGAAAASAMSTDADAHDAALGDAAHGCEVVSAPARAWAVAASPGLDSVTRCVRRGRARAGRIPVAGIL